MCTGTDSAHGTQYSLYIARVAERPPVTISWEHASFAHMVHDVLSSKLQK